MPHDHNAVAAGHKAYVDPNSGNHLRKEARKNSDSITRIGHLVEPRTELCVLAGPFEDQESDPDRPYSYWKVKVLGGHYKGEEGYMAEFYYAGNGKETRMMYGMEAECS